MLKRELGLLCAAVSVLSAVSALVLGVIAVWQTPAHHILRGQLGGTVAIAALMTLISGLVSSVLLEKL